MHGSTPPAESNWARADPFLRTLGGPWGAAALLVGACFAIGHALPPAGSLDSEHVVTRILFPGAVMSVITLVRPPSFVIVAHAGAHLAIPSLFA